MRVGATRGGDADVERRKWKLQSWCPSAPYGSMLSEWANEPPSQRVWGKSDCGVPALCLTLCLCSRQPSFTFFFQTVECSPSCSRRTSAEVWNKALKCGQTAQAICGGLVRPDAPSASVLYRQRRALSSGPLTLRPLPLQFCSWPI